MSEVKKAVLDWAPILSPLLLLVVTLYVGSIKGGIDDLKTDIKSVDCKVTDLDSKLFKHMTNDEMHVLRSTVVTEAEYNMYIKMHQSEVSQIVSSFADKINQVQLNTNDRIEQLRIDVRNSYLKSK